MPDIQISSPGSAAVHSWYNRVSPLYFQTLGIPMLRGRNFTADEAAESAPLVILSAMTAEQLWPHSDPLGRVINVDKRAVQVIGIAGDIVTCCIPYAKDPALVYLPSTPAAAGESLLVRVHGDVEAARRELDIRLSALAPGAVQEDHPLDQYVAAGTYPFRAASWIGCALAGLALVLTISGIYGVMSYLVAQRTKEIGIRVALGATTAGVAGIVLRQSVRLAFVGLTIGTTVAAVISKLLTTQMVFLRPFDTISYIAGITLVLAAAMVAAWYPSRRAAAVDPITSLRYD